MRRIILLSGLLAVMTTACRETLVDNGTAEQGAVEIALTSTDSSTPRHTKAEETELPDVNDFKVELFTAEGVRIIRDQFSELSGQTIPLNVGNYTIRASHGNSLAVGFDAIYWMGETVFTVHPQTVESVLVTARMANVKAQVLYGEAIAIDYPDYYTLVWVESDKVTDKLTFAKDETRYGYLPSGKVHVELYAQVPDPEDPGSGNRVWRYCPFTPIDCEPNDFLKLYIDTKRLEGTATLTVQIDDEVEEFVQEFEVPADFLPQDAPSFASRGSFGENGSDFTFVEAVDYDGTIVDIKANGKLKELWLETVSPYFEGKGLPASVDLVSADAATRKILTDAGILYPEKPAGSRFAFVDFSGMSRSVVYDKDAPFTASFSLRAVDERGKETVSATYNIVQQPAEFVLNAADWNVYAKRMKGITADVTSGNASLVKLQLSSDGTTGWTDAAAATVNGTAVSYSDITGLTPGTNYWVRAIYNGNEENASAAVQLTTETAAQVGNAGFEEWSEENVKIYSLFGGAYQMTYYPYSGSSRTWDANNPQTVHSVTTPSNYTFKAFPMVTWVAGRTGGKAAQLMPIAINNSNTSGTSLSDATPAELFTGVYGGDRKVSFPSRPSKLGFWYKYTSRNTDTYHAYVKVMNGETVIGEGEFTSQAAQSLWTFGQCEVTYTDVTKKATHIYIEFKPSVNSKPPYTKNVSISYPAGYANVHGGNILVVDDVELIYE